MIQTLIGIPDQDLAIKLIEHGSCVRFQLEERNLNRKPWEESLISISMDFSLPSSVFEKLIKDAHKK